MTTEDIEEQVTEEVTEPTPFLRITSTFATDAGRVETLTLDLHLNDADPVGEYDPARPGEREAAKSWVLDLVCATIRELRGDRQPTVVVAGPAVHDVLAEQKAREMLGHPGSDRWTGGDRKDGH